MFKQKKSSDLAKKRNKQIEALLKLKNVKQLSKDGDAFDVHFQSQNSSNKQSFRIELPKKFPESPPIIRFVEPVLHPQIDASCRVVGHTDLRNQGVSKSLHRIVSELVYQFTLNPPTLSQQHQTQMMSALDQSGILSQQHLYTNPNVKAQNIQRYNYQLSTQQQYQQQKQQYQSPPTSNSLQDQKQLRYQQYQQKQKQNQVDTNSLPNSTTTTTSNKYTENKRHIPAIPIPNEFPELQKLSDTELKQLILRSDLLHDFVEKFDSVKNLCVVRENLQTSIVDHSQRNLDLKEKFDGACVELKGLYSEIDVKEKELEKLKVEQSRIRERYSPRSICSKIDEFVDHIRQRAEKLRQDLDQSSIDESISDFIRDYRQLQQDIHELLVKKERMCQLLGQSSSHMLST